MRTYKHKGGDLYSIGALILSALPTGMRDGVDLKIEFICGLELFNTVPDHNDKTWSQGWRITDPTLTYPVESEYLDDAIKKWLEKRIEGYENATGGYSAQYTNWVAVYLKGGF